MIRKYKAGIISLFLFVFVIYIGDKNADNMMESSPEVRVDSITAKIEQKKSDLVFEETEKDKENILWLARVIYSETKVENEMSDIAWVVRNRVETGYMGDDYKEVALKPYQFSGLNSFDRHYQHNISRTFKSENRTWKRAVKVARNVYSADEDDRPFSKKVRHFYSPVAVSAPSWAKNKRPVKVHRSQRNPESVRFAFFQNVI